MASCLGPRSLGEQLLCVLFPVLRHRATNAGRLTVYWNSGKVSLSQFHMLPVGLVARRARRVASGFNHLA